MLFTLRGLKDPSQNVTNQLCQRNEQISRCLCHRVQWLYKYRWNQIWEDSLSIFDGESLEELESCIVWCSSF